MAIEIERRFLVADPEAALRSGGLVGWSDLRQGYFGRDEKHKIRVRITYGADGSRVAHLTRKTPRRGVCREELELPLDVAIAEQALASLAPSQIICKRRYLVRHPDGHQWAIDCFRGRNAGLVIGEVELEDPEEAIALPAWVGDEITFDPRFGNSALAKTPAPAAARLSGIPVDGGVAAVWLRLAEFPGRRSVSLPGTVIASRAPHD